MTNSKKRILIPLGCLAILFIMIIGISYAYYVADVKGNTSIEPSLQLKSGYLSIQYNEKDASISGNGTAETNYKKTFTIKNDGVADTYFGIWIKDYDVYKLDENNNKIYTETNENGEEIDVSYFERPQDWTYILGFVSDTNSDNKIDNEDEIETIIKTGTLPTEDAAIITSYPIAIGEERSLQLIITYAETDEIQNADRGKVLSFNVNVTQALNNLESAQEGTLLYAIKNNVYSETNTSISTKLIEPTLLNATDYTIPGQAVTSENEAIITSTEDDYGTSYYFRGAVTNNYVNYSGMCWRIVRVQGDGTIKLILADEKGLCNADTYSVNNRTTAFINDDKTYMYSEDSSETGVTYASSNIPGELSTWMASKITDTSDLVTTEWCNDMSISSIFSYGYDDNGEEDESLTDYTDLYYGAYGRLENKTTASPSLKCNAKGINDSKAIRYESNIGLLTADEVAFAGGANGTANSTYYLSTNANGGWYWTMSPYYFDVVYDSPYVWGVGLSGILNHYYVVNAHAVRPAVVLQSNVTIKNGGVGTQTNPYEIN